MGYNSSTGRHTANMTRTYFAREGRDGPIKIGASKNPWARVHEGNVWNPRPLRLLLVIEGCAERELHERFSHLRIRGEWFRAEAELVQFINDELDWQESESVSA